jgi:DeoR family transcriptional regulator, fructose operon transcriptional repressor
MKKELIFVEERKRDILAYVESRKKATVAELCERFGVSSATIRSDLRDLEQGGGLVRTHGGAIVRGQARFEPDASEKGVQRREEKRAIAALALAAIEDGDTVVLDTGSTTFELAELLDSKRDITVLTNDLAIAMRLEQHPTATVHLLGGVLRKRFHCTVGSRAEGSLRGLTVDKAFMAANGFSLEKGAGTPDLQQAELKKLMMSIAMKVYLLADSSKMGKNSFATFASLGEFDCFITDAISAEDAKVLEEAGVEVLSASPVAPETKGE